MPRDTMMWKSLQVGDPPDLIPHALIRVSACPRATTRVAAGAIFLSETARWLRRREMTSQFEALAT